MTERLVHQQLSTYLESNNLLTQSQYGFRSGRSSEMALLSVTEPILRGMEDHKFSLLCLLDLSKAFDWVPHHLLLDKLRRLGISDPWFQSYLTVVVVIQVVRLGNTLSDSAGITCGVPQASILGPVFFIVHTNQIPSLIKDRVPRTRVTVYADDMQTLNQATKKHVPQMFIDASVGVETAGQCFGEVGLKMNSSKTQSILCGTAQALVRISPVPSLNIGGEIVSTENVVKDLGMITDRHMTFS